MDETNQLTSEDVLNSFKADFGTTTSETTETETTEPAKTETTTSEETTSQSATSTDDTASEEDTSQAQTENQTQAPDNRAFASMRVQNKKMAEMLSVFAKQQGIEGKPEEVLEKLQEHLALEQAKKEGIPEPVAKELAKLREKAQGYEEFQVQQLARVGFQKVKTDFNLTPEELEKFADQLVSEGINPFKQTLDLPMEFLKRNYTSLVKQAEERGAKREAERLNKVSTQGSAPNTKSSVGNSTSAKAEKVESVKEFENWLEQNIKI